MPINSVYREFTVGYIQQNVSLWILATVEHETSREVKDIPSWVPDYSVNAWADHTMLWDRGTYCATRDMPTFFSWNPEEPNVLVLKAKCFKRIIAIESGQVKARNSEGDRILECVGMSERFPPWRGDHIAVLWRTLVGDVEQKNRDTIRHPASENTKLDFFGCLECMMLEQYELSDDEAKREQLIKVWAASSNTKSKADRYARVKERRKHFLGEVKRFMLGKRFCITEDGYYGMVPQPARVGDVICVFQGAAVPFVMRHADKGRYTLVGECYVHDLMHGEAVTFGTVESRDPFEEIQLI
jgi:hypothetical protein